MNYKILLLLLLFASILFSQDKKCYISALGSYCLEKLFNVNEDRVVTDSKFTTNCSKNRTSGKQQDAWLLFQQIVVSQPLLDKNQKGFYLKSAEINNPSELVQPFEQRKDYPLRTFSGHTYIAGFTDHFTDFLLLSKAIS